MTVLKVTREQIRDALDFHGAAGPQAVPECGTPDCSSGWIHEAEGSRRCPICAAKDAEARLAKQLAGSGIGDRYLGTEWADLELVEPLATIRRAAERLPEILAAGHSAVLTGNPGSGKTQAAVLLAKACIRGGGTARVANIGRLAMDVRAAYDHRDGPTEAAVVDQLAGVDLLVLDDVGAGEAGAAQVEQRLLYFVTEARQNARRSTIVTTNLSADRLKERIGDRVMNRLMPLRVFAFTHGRNFRAPTGKTLWDEVSP